MHHFRVLNETVECDGNIGRSHPSFAEIKEEKVIEVKV